MTAVVRPTPWLPVAVAITRRSLVNIARVPAAFVPIVAMPVFFVIAFSGSFTSLTDLPGFPTDNILNFMVPFAIVQGASFAGFGTGFGTARDIENGFYDRFLLSPGRRTGLFVGPILAGSIRASLSLVIVLSVSFVLGVELPGGLPGLGALWLAAIGISIVATGWALGVVYRIQSQQAAPVLQVGIFFTLFLSTGQVPLDAQIGWVRQIARVNPATNVLTMARQGFLGDVTWSQTWPGLLALVGGAALLWIFAVRGMRRLVP